MKLSERNVVKLSLWKRMTVLVSALWVLGSAKLHLSRGGWRNLVSRLPACPADASGALPEKMEALAGVCYLGARVFPLQTECLERSFMTCYVLRRQGIPARLYVGMWRWPPLRFHAWVQVGEAVVTADNAEAIGERFEVLAQL